MIKDVLKQLLDSFEQDIKPLDEHTVGDQIHAVIKGKGIEPPSNNDYEIAEYIAFQFVSGFRMGKEDGDNYYRPKFISNTGKKTSEFPGATQVNDEVLDYWKRRAKNAKHPVFALKYADLVVDFEKRKTGFFNFEMVKLVIDNTIKVCTDQLVDEHGLMIKLERAFYLMKRINYTHSLDELTNAALNFERRSVDNNKPGLWGMPFVGFYYLTKKK